MALRQSKKGLPKKAESDEDVDEKASNIEDRIWGSRVIDKGFKIMYEPKASVFHFHGVHHLLGENLPQISNLVQRIQQQTRNA